MDRQWRDWGYSALGTISNAGLYSAPAHLPNPTSVTITATSQADTSKSANASMTVTSDVAVSVATNPAFTLSVPTSLRIPLIATIASQGKPDQSVDWRVNGIAGGNPTVGTVSVSGPAIATYQAPDVVPAPFTVNIQAISIADGSKSAGVAIIVAGTIATITQTISAASGGTIALPDGSSVTFAPNALPADQSVTASEVSYLPQQPANPGIIGVGTGLVLTFSNAPAFSATAAPASFSRITPLSSGSGGTAAIQFTINTSANSVPQLNGSVPVANFVTTTNNNSFMAVDGNYDSTLGTVSGQIRPDMLSAISNFFGGAINQISSIAISAANIVQTGFQVLAHLYVAPNRLVLNVNSTNVNPNQWTNWDGSFCPGGHSVVFVHGMASSVENSFSPVTIKSIENLSGYAGAFGFDYDWLQSINTSGGELASFLDSLATKCGAAIDIEAHSEGVAVTLSALTQTNLGTNALIKRLNLVAGPIMGTPAASDSRILGGFMMGISGFSLAGAGVLNGLGALLNSPFTKDLQPSLPGSNDVLDTIRSSLGPSSRQGVPQIILVAGNSAQTWYLQALASLMYVTYGVTNSDGIIPVTSGLAFPAGLDALEVYPIYPFALEHTNLVPDPNVIKALAAQANSQTATPSLLITSTGSCSNGIICGGLPGSAFALSGSSYSPGSKIGRYMLDSTGVVSILSPSLTTNSSGMLPNQWNVSTNCSTPISTSVYFATELLSQKSSNAVTEQISSGNCVGGTNPIPTLTFISPSSIPVGTFSLTVNGTNFIPQSQAFLGTTALSSTYISSTQLAAIGTATTSQIGNVPMTVTNPTPGGGTSNAVRIAVVNTSSSASGSTGIITGTVGGQVVDLAYVPQPFPGTVAVINVDSTSPTTALVTTIPMPLGYSPNATAANPATSQVIVISYASPLIQLIDATKNIIANTFLAPVTTSAGYSGGSCQICGAVIDPVTGNAVLDTALGTILLNLTTGIFSPAFPTLAAENFAYNPNTQMALLPTYGQGAFTGLQVLNTGTGTVTQLSNSVGSEPDSAAVDISTNIAVIPDEFTAIDYIVNLQQIVPSGSTFTAPTTAFQMTAPPCQPLWTLTSIENASHILFVGTEFDSCLGMAQLPPTLVPGAVPVPTSFVWGQMSAAPDASAWDNGGDPHGIAVFTSVVNGKPYGFLVDSNGPWVARIDLQGLAGAPALSGGYPGQVNVTPFVTFFKTQ